MNDPGERSSALHSARDTSGLPVTNPNASMILPATFELRLRRYYA